MLAAWLKAAFDAAQKLLEKAAENAAEIT